MPPLDLFRSPPRHRLRASVHAGLLAGVLALGCAHAQPPPVPTLAGAAPGGRLQALAPPRADHPPSEARLIRLLDGYERSQDDVGVIRVLEELVVFHPHSRQCATLLARTQKRWGPDHRLTLDVMRLRRIADTLHTADDYMTMARLSLRTGFPAEAKAVLDQGFARRILGNGSARDVQAQKALRVEANRRTSADLLRLVQPEPEPEAVAVLAGDGLALMRWGMSYVTHHAYGRGIALMEQGLRIGVADRGREAMLRLVIAYLYGGQRDRAASLLRSLRDDVMIVDEQRGFDDRHAIIASEPLDRIDGR